MMQNFDCIKFCEKVITLFGDMGQIELSQKIGISQGVISAIKNKKSKAPGADTLFKIASYFDVSVDWLVGYERNAATATEEHEMDTMKIFAQRFIDLRKKNNVSQQEIADAVGATRQSIGRYEVPDRKININLLAKIARYFGVSSDYLLGLSDAPCADTSGCEHYIAHEENKLRKQREDIADALEKMAASLRD